MSREPTNGLPRVVASGTFALGALATLTSGVGGGNSNYWFVPLVILAPSALAASGALLTSAGTTAFGFAAACCAIVCFGSLLEALVASSEAVVPVGDFAIAGAVGIGWAVQVFPALGAATAGLISWRGRAVRSRNAGD